VWARLYYLLAVLLIDT